MPSDTFYNKNDQALKQVNIETRNALPELAVKILIARNPDFASMRSEELISELKCIIDDLQKAYLRVL